jgi:hypothetical protein
MIAKHPKDTMSDEEIIRRRGGPADESPHRSTAKQSVRLPRLGCERLRLR